MEQSLALPPSLFLILQILAAVQAAPLLLVRQALQARQAAQLHLVNSLTRQVQPQGRRHQHQLEQPTGHLQLFTSAQQVQAALLDGMAAAEEAAAIATLH